MSKVKRIGLRMLASVLTVFMAFGIAFAGIAPKAAYAGEDEVRAVSNGVFKFNWRYKGQDYSRGSCFLINSRHVLTAYHCMMFTPGERAKLELLDIDVDELVKDFDYTITVSNDVQVGATLVNYSEEQDWAVFKLKQKIGGSEPIKIRDSSTVKSAETVWSVAFPADSDSLKVIHTYTPDDVTIKRGTVSKPEDIYETIIDDWLVRGYFLQTDVAISGGDSGGPMVDDQGNVIGINDFFGGNYYYCVGSDKVTAILDRLNIKYSKVDLDSVPVPVDEHYSLTDELDTLQDALDDANAKKADGKTYTDETMNALDDAIAAGKKASGLTLSDDTDLADYNDKKAQIESATGDLIDATSHLVEAPAPNYLPFIIGGVVAAAAIIGGIVFALSRKKKAAQEVAAAAAQPVVPAPTPQVGPASASKPAPALTPAEVAEPATDVLVEDDPATTVMTENVDAGTLTRMSTNEKIPINRTELTLGRERRSVDYCLEGNNNIGRVHARIIVRDDVVYIVDNNSTNGTFVNNAKLRPGLEQQLKSGDIIRLADEKFRYNR